MPGPNAPSGSRKQGILKRASNTFDEVYDVFWNTVLRKPKSRPRIQRIAVSGAMANSDLPCMVPAPVRASCLSVPPIPASEPPRSPSPCHVGTLATPKMANSLSALRGATSTPKMESSPSGTAALPSAVSAQERRPLTFPLAFPPHPRTNVDKSYDSTSQDLDAIASVAESDTSDSDANFCEETVPLPPSTRIRTSTTGVPVVDWQGQEHPYVALTPSQEALLSARLYSSRQASRIVGSGSAGRGQPRSRVAPTTRAAEPLMRASSDVSVGPTYESADSQHLLLAVVALERVAGDLSHEIRLLKEKNLADRQAAALLYAATDRTLSAMGAIQSTHLQRLAAHLEAATRPFCLQHLECDEGYPSDARAAMYSVPGEDIQGGISCGSDGSSIGDVVRSTQQCQCSPEVATVSESACLVCGSATCGCGGCRVCPGGAFVAIRPPSAASFCR